MNMKNLKIMGLGIALMCFASTNAQQIKTPAPSPYAEVKQVIGLTDVNVTYSRPGVKGRTIFGDLVAYGTLWRTGANRATTIEVEGDVSIGGKEVKKGKYSVFSIPGKDEWTVIINSDATASTGKYKKENDVCRITVKPNKTSAKIETFTIQFANLKDNSADLQIMWENTLVSIPVTVDVEKQVLAKIDNVMAGPSSRDLYAAAKYYYDNDKDINQAVKWINKSVEMDGENQKFWVVHWQAQILAKSGDKKAAIAAAEKSKALAEKAEYDEYVKKNETLINSLK